MLTKSSRSRLPTAVELAASWGIKPSAATGMKILKFAPLRSGSMLGFVSVETPAGMIINDCRLMTNKEGQYWLGLPARPLLDAKGRQILDVNGKKSYPPVIEFRDRETRERFCNQVIAAVRAKFPDGVDGEGGA